MLVHTVFFNFAEASTEADIQSCADDARNLLGKIETVKALYVGSPADTEVRPVSIRDFDLCLTVVFDSIADHDVYQTHSLHDDFIANNKDNWAKVQVYDAD
ncbi:MAG TPA: hypothetical protein DIV79_07950 [Opitutae bacterium]|nr:hypothetical protein [Opitutaceae bacterium]HCR29932.1 hypothetical protein [Opitutae bacterium]|tara:strand:- start:660 stop:962 length:303 start_codon:yes stop_codon:yes gene_type:complete